jgi:hypothetical protein
MDVLGGDVHANSVKGGTEVFHLVGSQVDLGHSQRSHVDSSHFEDGLLGVESREHLNPSLNNINGLHLEGLSSCDISIVPLVGGLKVVSEEVHSAGDISVTDTSGESTDNLLITAEKHVVFLVFVMTDSVEIHEDLVGEFNSHKVGDFTSGISLLNELEHVEVNHSLGGEVVVPEREVGSTSSYDGHGVNKVRDGARFEVDGRHAEDTLHSS